MRDGAIDSRLHGKMLAPHSNIELEVDSVGTGGFTEARTVPSTINNRKIRA